MRLSHLILHRLHRFGLILLIGRIFAHKTQSSIHLRQISGTEHKHQSALQVAVAMHVLHRLDEALLALFEFFVQCDHLHLQRVDITIQTIDIMTNGINRLTFIGNLVVDNQQVLQTILHIALVGFQLALLLLNLLAHPLLLGLQTVNRYRLL